MNVKITAEIGDIVWAPQGRGISNTISKSNKRNKIATKKNRNEKGKRADPNGSNPHS